MQQQQPAQTIPVTNKTAVAFGFLFLFLQRFAFWFGSAFGVLAAFRVTGFLPGLFG